jgi:hypothetical protein
VSGQQDEWMNEWNEKMKVLFIVHSNGRKSPINTLHILDFIGSHALILFLISVLAALLCDH